MLKEVIIVEGKMDTLAVRRALEADTIETGGFNLSRRTLNDIEAAYRRRGIIIMTDPDNAGEHIRAYLTRRFPEAGQAFVPKTDATANNDTGIEQAQPAAILAALAKIRHHRTPARQEFTMQDLIKNGLNGAAAAAQNRARLGAKLGIGYANAKQFLHRLNSYGVTREEWQLALTE